jgi:hypothetical protein
MKLIGKGLMVLIWGGRGSNKSGPKAEPKKTTPNLY